MGVDKNYQRIVNEDCQWVVNEKCNNKYIKNNSLYKKNSNISETSFKNDLTIEDTRELRCDVENVTYMKSCEDVDMTKLLKSAMRQDPDRIIVGEVRGSEALALLKAWNTGHPGGISTLHANNAKNALVRLEQLILEGITTPQNQLIAESVDVVIYIKKIDPQCRKVTEIIEINGHKNEEYQTRVPLKNVK
ncbi:MAG TPA: hypothetical protein EYP35_06045 [Desulfobacterales bacterium]|nr:hypothetical protein [Desulfobacterales bacterium]